MKNLISLALFVVYSHLCVAQIDPSNIDIIRDRFGVPHIFAPTDAEVAYGLAYAHAEDDFKTIQLGYLAGNNMLTEYLGNQGIGADFIAQFIGSSALFDAAYESDIHPDYKKIIDAYAQGLNRYSQLHAEEVLYEGLFPLTPKKMMRYAQLQLFISSKGDQ